MTAAETVPQWIRQHSHPLTNLAPQDPLTDLAPLAGIVGNATVVALGASARQAHELSALSHRVVRYLVEELGFRTLALEGDDASRIGLEEYVRTGSGDPRDLLAGARSFWLTEEILDVVHWMRDFNRTHPQDPVRFAGIAPGPRREDPGLEGLAAIEWGLAENTVRWHEYTGDRIVYWGGVVHTAHGSPGVMPFVSGPTAHRNAGSYLRERFGDGYVSLGLTFHHGMAPRPMPAPTTEFAEAALGSAGLGAHLLNLHADGPAPVREWLHGATSVRLPDLADSAGASAGHYMTGGSLAGWFDAVLHVQEVTAVRPLRASSTVRRGGQRH